MSNPKIRFEIENYGSIEAERYPEIAPKTVENFLGLVKSGEGMEELFLGGFLTGDKLNIVDHKHVC